MRTAARFVVALTVLVAGCVVYNPPDAPPNPAPELVLDVLVIGDSVATGMADKLEAVATGEGYTLNVLDASVSGSGPAVDTVGYDWPDNIAAVIAAHPDADLAVVHFGGSSTIAGVAQNTSEWRQLSRQGTRAVNDAVDLAGLPRYTVKPPVFLHNCDPGTAKSQGWAWYQTFIDTEGYQVDYDAAFTPEGFTYDVIVNDEPVTIRTEDCIHFTDPKGKRYTAKEVMTVIAEQWTA